MHSLPSSYRVHAWTADAGGWDAGYHAGKMACVMPEEMDRAVSRRVHVLLMMKSFSLATASHCPLALIAVDPSRRWVADRGLVVYHPF